MAKRTANQAIINAILFQDSDAIRNLIEAEKNNLKEKTPPHNSPISHSIEYLIAAIKRGDVSILRYLIKEGLALSDVGGYFGGNSVYLTNALHLAVQYGQAEMLKELLMIDQINCNSRDPDGKTPLDYAQQYSGNGYLKTYMCEVLQSMQDYQDSGRVGSKFAAENLHLDTNQLPHKSNKITSGEFTGGNFGNEGNASKIWGEVSEIVNKKYAELLKKKKIFENREDSFLNKAFEGKLEEIDIVHFEEYGGTINVATDYKSKPGNQTALHRAAQNGHFEVVYRLLKHGASVDIKDSDGNTALDLAIQKFKKLPEGSYKEEYKKIAIAIKNAVKIIQPSPVTKPTDSARLGGSPIEMEID